MMKKEQRMLCVWLAGRRRSSVNGYFNQKEKGGGWGGVAIAIMMMQPNVASASKHMASAYAPNHNADSL